MKKRKRQQRARCSKIIRQPGEMEPDFRGPIHQPGEMEPDFRGPVHRPAEMEPDCWKGK